MNQEDGYIKIRAYKTNRPWIRWIIPVRMVTLEMLFDVQAWIFMSRGIGLDFNEFDKIPPEDYLPWAIYGGVASHASLSGKRGIKVEVIQDLIRGIVPQDQARIFECIENSRLYGQTIREYAEAAEAKGSKKVAPSESKS